MEEKISITPLNLFFAGSFLLLGLFREYGSCIYTFIWGLLLILGWHRKKNITICFNLEHFSIWMLAVGYFITCFYGIDRGMSFTGFMKFLSVVFFLGILNIQNSSEKKVLFQIIPIIGTFMTLTGILGWFLPPLRQFFYVSQRLGGFFQYPNVYALFCLVGILLLLEDFSWHRKIEIFFISTLFLGILLSGSRTVFFLALLSLGILCLCRKNLRKLILPVVLIFITFGIIYSLLSGNSQNVGRFLTASFSSSTLIGRIIYWKDGIQELLRHPFGLGYLGYFYRESTIQTAPYSIRFIHNDFLQLALDAGIIPGILFVIMCIRSVFFRKISLEKRLCIAIMCLHFFMDFDLEFTSVWYLFLLLAEDNKNSRNLSVNFEKICRGFCILFSCLSLYIGFAMIPRYFGNALLTAQMLPFYTENNIALLSAETNPETAATLSEKILKQNPYIAEAYDIRAILALQDKNYDLMIQSKEKSLSLQKYNMEAYDNYLKLLSIALTDAATDHDRSAAITLLNAIQKVPDILSDIKNNTTPLAYRTKDAPDFTLSDSSDTFLKQAKNLLNKKFD